MRRESSTWVSQPSQHGRRWRLTVGAGTGGRYLSYETREEAETARRRLLAEIQRQNREAQALTWEEAIDQYTTHLKERGCLERSVETVHGRLRRFFQDRLEDPVKLSEEQAVTLYKNLRTRPCKTGEPVSVQEHHHCLSRAKALGEWLVKGKVWRQNPLTAVEPVGRPKRGEESKPQLRLDEARHLIDIALEHGERGDAGAVATLCALVCGMRATAIATRTVRDLDDRGRALWTAGKTAAGRVRLRLVGSTPEEDALLARFRAVLALQARGKSPMDPLIGTGHDRWWVRRQVNRLCQLAQVPLVCAHALRGTHISAAYEEGESPAMVARSVGHTGEAVARRHYATLSSQAAGSQRRALTALQGQTLIEQEVHKAEVPGKPFPLSNHFPKQNGEEG